MSLNIHSLVDVYTDKENKDTVKKIDSETDFSSTNDYDECANEIPFVGDILQPIQFDGP